MRKLVAIQKGRTDGTTDRPMDGQTDGRTDGRTYQPDRATMRVECITTRGEFCDEHVGYMHQETDAYDRQNL